MGYLINHKTVFNLMKQLGLKSIVRAKRYHSYKGKIGKVADNHLKRDFDSARPYEKWVTDVTEFKVDGQKVYLSPIMDLYNAEIISFQISQSPNMKMVMGMLNEAIAGLNPEETPMIHSDQGWQYQMKEYCHTLKEKGLKQSMSRKGNCLDNAAMESFFGVLKREFYHRQHFESVSVFIEELKEYIRYYNHDRIKLKLKGLSPVEYRTQALE
jgi:putative transposase